MASLTLKNLPDTLLDSLRSAAEKDRRSLTQQIIYLLDRGLQDPGERPAATRPGTAVQVAAWRKLAGAWQSDVDRETETKRVVEKRSLGRKVEL